MEEGEDEEIRKMLRAEREVVEEVEGEETGEVKKKRKSRQMKIKEGDGVKGK